MASSFQKLRVKIHIYRIFAKLVSFKTLLKVLFTKKAKVKVPLNNGVDFTLRTGVLDDISVAGYVFVNEYHIPPFKLPKNATIVDLGSNIGCTIMDYSLKYPDARVLGVEMDRNNFHICKENVAQFKNVTVSNNAVWFENGVVRYNTSTNNDAYSAVGLHDQEGGNEFVEVESIRVSSLLEKNNIEKVDFMKIDIEGAEHEIFNKDDMSWLNSVNSLHIEIHHNDWIKPITETLEKFDFTIIPDEKHWSALFAKKKSVNFN
jgi:FkbM family methyltransferase